uniref:Uncharacterized protein n=1 Tax=Neogobius melanostomus TaxID=47308 RepID=A0A8C6WH06_9GOBI
MKTVPDFSCMKLKRSLTRKRLLCFVCAPFTTTMLPSGFCERDRDTEEERRDGHRPGGLQ